MKRWLSTKSAGLVKTLTIYARGYESPAETYGAAYGPGANTSLIQNFQETSAGKPYYIVHTDRKAAISIEDQLRTARLEGCFALLTKVVGWNDGRVMQVEEWAIMYMQEARDFDC